MEAQLLHVVSLDCLASGKKTLEMMCEPHVVRATYFEPPLESRCAPLIAQTMAASCSNVRAGFYFPPPSPHPLPFALFVCLDEVTLIPKGGQNERLAFILEILYKIRLEGERRMCPNGASFWETRRTMRGNRRASLSDGTSSLWRANGNPKEKKKKNKFPSFDLHLKHS